MPLSRDEIQSYVTCNQCGRNLPWVDDPSARNFRPGELGIQGMPTWICDDCPDGERMEFVGTERRSDGTVIDWHRAGDRFVPCEVLYCRERGIGVGPLSECDDAV